MHNYIRRNRNNNNRKIKTIEKGILNGEVIVTEHAIDRYLQRVDKNVSRAEAKEKIISSISESKLIYIKNNEEHRKVQKFTYVIKREKDKINFLRENITVVTIKIPRVEQKFDESNMAYKAIGIIKPA